MMKQGGGKVVNISSRGAFEGEPDSWAYGASKAGLNSLGQSMAKALAPHVSMFIRWRRDSWKLIWSDPV